GEVLALLPSPLAHERPQLGVVVGEELEGRGGGPLLTHEQERQLGCEEEEGRGRAVRGRRYVVGEAVAGGTVAHLVVVLDADDALLGTDGRGARAARPARPAARLAVVEPAFSNRLGEVRRRRPGEVGEVARGVAGGEVADLVVEVVGP